MARLLQLNDPHLSETPPSSRTAFYCMEVLDKLAWVLAKARELHVDVLICTGDWFHSKIAQRTPYWLINRLLRMLADEPYQILSIAGNHDFPPGFGDLDRQPYNTLIASGLVCDIHDKVFTCGDGTDIVGCRYHDQDAFAHILNMVAKYKPDVLVLHQQIEPPGSTQIFEFIPADKLVGVAKLVLYGHVHDYHGIYDVTVEGFTIPPAVTTFSNPGNISRGSIAERDLKRTPSVAFFDTATGEREVIGIPHKPIEEVFLLDKIERRKMISLDIERFVETVEQTQFVALSHDVVRGRLLQIEDAGVRTSSIDIWDQVG